MRVRLIDIENKYREKKRRGDRFPNRALMGWSRYYKDLGALVDFDIEDPDITIISCVFTKNYPHALAEAGQVTKGLYWGGSGIPFSDQYKGMGEGIETLKPDYDLYLNGPWPDSKHFHMSLGFTTRGCPRDCPWCIVREKEGRFRRAQHISEFHDFRFKSCKLLDNNILADRDWFFENTNWAIDHKVQIDITQGMDIRLLTDEIAEQLHRIKFVDQQMRFAWDRIEMEPVVKAGIETLRDHKINVRRNVSFYVLSGFHLPGKDPEPFCQDVYRCNRLHDFGSRGFVMPYEDGTPLIRALARWANRPTLRDTPFYLYDRMPTSNTAGKPQQPSTTASGCRGKGKATSGKAAGHRGVLS